MTETVVEGPHRRFNPLTGQWVLVSAGRTSRPWQGAVGSAAPDNSPHYDPTCYLCPKNSRASGDANPDYDPTFVFTNDFAALRPETGREMVHRGLIRAEGEEGTCRVLCFSPRHDLTLARMTTEQVRIVIDLWANQTEELGRTWRWVQVFENRGEMMGASNPHPHGQIWAGSALPVEPAAEDANQLRHWSEHGRRLLLDYVDQDGSSERVVVENDEWVILVPFWAVWPFETLIVPRRPATRLTELDGDRRDSLADALRRMLIRYDNLFEHPFPYSMGWHGAPFGPESHEHWQLHGHIYPPLLRSATVRKFMVGYELLAEAQRDITAEEAADRLRACSEVHYAWR